MDLKNSAIALTRKSGQLKTREKDLSVGEKRTGHILRERLWISFRRRNSPYHTGKMVFSRDVSHLTYREREGGLARGKKKGEIQTCPV